jgi:hypothetical protein
MKTNERLVDDLARTIRNGRTDISSSVRTWDQLLPGTREDYRKQAKAVLAFLAKEDEKTVATPEHMPAEQLAELIYDAYNRHYGGPGAALSTASPAKKGPYMAMAQAVIDAGRAPTVTVDWRKVLSDATVPTFIQVPPPATVTVTANAILAKKPLPEGIKEFAWIGRSSEGMRFFSDERVATSWLQNSQRSGAKLYKIRIDWAVPYKLMLVPGNE